MIIRKSIKLNTVLHVIQRCCHIIIPLLLVPYLTRALGPTGYGKFTFSNSINSYFLLTAMLGINTYAVREGARIRDNGPKIERFSAEILSINVVSMLVSAVLLVLCAFLVPRFREYRALLLILGLILPCTCFGREWINTVYEDYLYTTVRYLAIQVLGIVAVFLLIRSETDVVRYTLIYTMTICLGYLVNLVYTRRHVRLRLTLRPGFSRHVRPILTLFLAQVAVTIYIQSDITMVGLFSGDHQVGIYSLAAQVYITGSSILGAMTTVSIPRSVYYLGQNDPERYKAFVGRLASYLFLFVVPAAVGLYMTSVDILHALGGVKYLSGETSLKILSAAMFFAIFSGFFCNVVLIPHRREKTFLFITASSALTNIVLNLFFIPRFGIAGAAFTTIVSECLVLLLSWNASRSFVRITVSRRTLFSVLLGGLVVYGVCFICKSAIDGYLLRLFLSVVFSVAAYFSVLLVFREALATESLKKVIAFILDGLRKQ